MKKLIAFYILFQIGNIFGQSTEQLKLYSIKELRDDIDSLTKYLEETHPNSFYKFPRNEFYKETERIKNEINKPITAIDFFILLQPLVVKLEDGHTSIFIPYDYYDKSNPYVFPYNVKLSVNKPFISVISPFQTIKSELPSGSEIININGIEADKIINDIIKLCAGESKAFRADRGAYSFEFYLNTLYGMSNYYTVKYKTNNTVETKTIDGIKYDSLIKRQEQDTTKATIENLKDYYLKLIPETKTAIIDFQSFNDLGKFKIFIDSAFGQIKANKIENLIIDIRYNGGGNSAIGDEFFQYISHCTFKQYSKAIIKYSRLQKECYKNFTVKYAQDSSILNTLKKPNGLMEEDTSESKSITLRDNPLRFNGNIYLLTSTKTFSSAADFAQCFKYYKMGKIIGEETGGWILCYGDVIYGILPNTEIDISISHKLFYNIGANENDWHGVIPDIKVPSEKALDYTLKLINNQ